MDCTYHNASARKQRNQENLGGIQKKRKLIGNSLAEMIQARRQQNDIFEVLKDICHSRISFPPQISFNYEVKKKEKRKKIQKNRENIEIQRKTIEKYRKIKKKEKKEPDKIQCQHTSTKRNVK